MTKSKSSSTNAAVQVSALMGKLDELAVARHNFESTDWVRTNQKLYSLLGDVYARYEDAAANAKVLRLTVKALTAVLKERGNRVQQNSTALSLFVRYVFSSDRQRIFTYTRALQAAKASGIKPAQFADFVNQAGGIEECKTKVSPSEKTVKKQQQIAAAMPLVDEILDKDGSTVLAQFKVDALMFEAIKEHEVTFLLGTCDEKGSIKVRSVVPGYSEGYEKWAKEKMAEYLHAQKSASDQKTAEAAQDKAVEEVLSQIAKANHCTVKVGELA